MGKIGRRRKHSHWFYGRSKKIQVNKENTPVPSGKISSLKSSVPLKYSSLFVMSLQQFLTSHRSPISQVYSEF